nr:MAG TPA: hypothetical protein [Caudoviricetes sp.]
MSGACDYGCILRTENHGTNLVHPEFNTKIF